MISYVALVQTWPVINSATSQILKITGAILTIGLPVKSMTSEGWAVLTHVIKDRRNIFSENGLSKLLSTSLSALLRSDGYNKFIATRWTPKLEINTNTKIEKFPWKTGRRDGWTYYTATQGIWNSDLRPHALHAITGRAHNYQKQCGQPDRETEGQTYKIKWNPLGSFGPQFGG